MATSGIWFKTSLMWADMVRMMLSDEQARLAARDILEGRSSGPIKDVEISPETLEQARQAVLHAPDVRAERVLEACTRLLTEPLDSHDLANKMISRIVTDAIR